MPEPGFLRAVEVLTNALLTPQEFARHKPAPGQQELRWITIHSHGEGEEGRRIQINTKTGEIEKGFGAGKTMHEAFAPKSEAPAASEIPKPAEEFKSPFHGDEESRHWYGASNRPIGHATVPRGFVETKNHDAFRHGAVAYPQPLSEKDQYDYELTPIHGDDAIPELAKKLGGEMDKYASQYADPENDGILDDFLGQEGPRKLLGHVDKDKLKAEFRKQFGQSEESAPEPQKPEDAILSKYPSLAEPPKQAEMSEMVRAAAGYQLHGMRNEPEDRAAWREHSQHMTKSAIDGWLMKKFGIDSATARAVSNAAGEMNPFTTEGAGTVGGQGVKWNHNSPEPTMSELGDMPWMKPKPEDSLMSESRSVSAMTRDQAEQSLKPIKTGKNTTKFYFDTGSPDPANDSTKYPSRESAMRDWESSAKSPESPAVPPEIAAKYPSLAEPAPDPSKMSLADKLAYQKANPGKGKIKTPEKQKPKQTVTASGAKYEFVKDNGDGTATVRNEQGNEFSTDPGEPWSLDAPEKSGQVSPSPEKSADGLVSDNTLFKRTGQQFEEIQKSLGIKNPKMGKPGADAVRKALASRPGGPVIAELLRLHEDHPDLFQRHGFTSPTEAAVSAIDGKFTKDQLVDASRWAASHESGEISRFMRDHIRAASGTDGRPDSTEHSAASAAGGVDRLSKSHGKEQAKALRSEADGLMESSKKPFKPEGIPGEQMGLFDQDAGGQKSLFNVVKPDRKSKKAEPTASTLEKIGDEHKARSEESAPLPGQKSMSGLAEKPKSIAEADGRIASQKMASDFLQESRDEKDQAQRKAKVSQWRSGFTGSPKENNASGDITRHDWEKAMQNGVPPKRLSEMVDSAVQAGAIDAGVGRHLKSRFSIEDQYPSLKGYAGEGSKPLYATSDEKTKAGEEYRTALAGAGKFHASRVAAAEAGVKAGHTLDEMMQDLKDEGVHEFDAKRIIGDAFNKAGKPVTRSDQPKPHPSDDDWKPENHVKIAADDIGKLRKQDVYRLMENATGSRRAKMADYIRQNRPELAGEVQDSLDDFGGDSTAPEPAKAAESKPSGHAIDPLDIGKHNIAEVLENQKADILKSDPKLSPNAAASLAGARVFNALHGRSEEFRKGIDDRVRKGEEISDDEDAKYMAAGDARKNLHSDIVQHTGYRPMGEVDGHPEANKPLVGGNSQSSESALKAKAKPAKFEMPTDEQLAGMSPKRHQAGYYLTHLDSALDDLQTARANLAKAKQPQSGYYPSTLKSAEAANKKAERAYKKEFLAAQAAKDKYEEFSRKAPHEELIHHLHEAMNHDGKCCYEKEEGEDDIADHVPADHRHMDKSVHDLCRHLGASHPELQAAYENYTAAME